MVVYSVCGWRSGSCPKTLSESLPTCSFSYRLFQKFLPWYWLTTGRPASETSYRKACIFFTMAQQPPVGRGLLIIEASRSHSDATQSVGLLWTSHQPDVETSTWQQTSHKTKTSMPPVGFEPAIPASERPQTHVLNRASTGTGKGRYTLSG